MRLGSSGSRSSGSALSSDGSFGKSEHREFKINYTGDPFHLVNFKTPRKRRSQVIWGSFNFKPTHLMMNPACDLLSTCSVDSKDESCLSTGSSEVSSVESRIRVRNQKSNEKLRGEGKKMKESSRSSSIRRRAKDILEFLSSESSSEVHIRQILGDSPDTSKALRMLLKMDEVKRFGTGGRLDPFIYKVRFQGNYQTLHKEQQTANYIKTKRRRKFIWIKLLNLRMRRSKLMMPMRLRRRKLRTQIMTTKKLKVKKKRRKRFWMTTRNVMLGSVAK